MAFKTPDGKTVLIVYNAGQSSESFAIRDGPGEAATATLTAGAVGTYVW